MICPSCNKDKPSELDEWCMKKVNRCVDCQKKEDKRQEAEARKKDWNVSIKKMA